MFSEVTIMRIAVLKSSKDSESVYVIKDLYLRDVRGKKSTKNKSGKDRTTVTVANLGKINDLMKEKEMTREEVIAWAKDEAKRMTMEDKKERQKISFDFFPNVRIEKDVKRCFNCGYLFPQSIYYDLRMDNVCRNITARHKFKYSLDAILSDLIYARILEPSSKRASYKFCQSLLEAPKYKEHDVYRALSVLAEEMDYIQSEVYKNSNLVLKRNSRALYYDCTNYYFEIEEEDDFRKYGKSKENRPNPIVQMGLFMDGNGIPMAFDLFSGNKSEQPSMKPLEQKIIRDYGVEKFIVCTDAGLGSEGNRLFNDIEGRAFIVTQSLKKLKKDEREAAMSDEGWRCVSDNKPVDIKEIKGNPESFLNQLYYKEEPYGTAKVPGQIMFVTYSPRYALYQKSIRDKQIKRAEEMVQAGKKGKSKRNSNDPSRFVKKISVTEDGEVADKTEYSLDTDKIQKESYYDGYYAVCTNLVEDSVQDILKVSEGRWEIEESFRIMKTDFEARPTYLSREDRIKAHFLTCYLSLLIYRILEKKIEETYTSNDIISTLRGMNLLALEGYGYQPAYTRTDLTDKLHDVFGFNTDFQILEKSTIRSIIKGTKQH
jgi:transposase